ncbi:MAG: PQQ-binding-like beta-propeller repeat protein [Luteitalea sp.]|nr:PQQ-binding-like beta-propeller repeat protein [Luteitalea sp.]
MRSNTRRLWLPFLGAAGLIGLLLGAWLVRGAWTLEEQRWTTWSDYGGSSDSMQYSALTQINKTNVSSLELAWHYPVPDRTGNFGFNPIVVDGVMYVLGRENNIVALEATTGKVIWSHAVDGEGSPGNRGINYWESEDRSDRRLIYAASGALWQIDAQTGEAITAFGDNGRVEMRVGQPRVLGSPSGTPGRVYENLFITGSNTGERYFSPPGDIRAYDVITGKLVWTFHTVPRPSEHGHDTWPPEAWKYAGGANTWGEISIDEKRGIAYVPTGSPTHDLYGGDRLGANLFANCLLALDARTGKRLWHFQAVHHDLWDYDLTAAPKLLTVRHDGEMVDVVAQPTKFGFLYVFNRETGEPLWPIEERPVPASDVPGEKAWPTQPFPTKPPPFARQEFKEDDINPYLDPKDKEAVHKRFLAARAGRVFTPQLLDREQIMMPGQFGGANFGGSAADPETGFLYVRTTDHPTIHQLREFDPDEERKRREGSPEVRGRAVYEQMCVTCHGKPQQGGIQTMDRSGLIAISELSADYLEAQIREGQGQMPAFTEDVISDDDLEDLMAFLGRPADDDEERSRERRPVATDSARKDGMTLYPGTRYTGPLGRAFQAESGLSAIGPPWSEIVAYDLNEGTIKWRAPFGTSPALAARGITNTGNGRRAWRNGPVVTAGGLIFVGSWADRMLRAFDKDNGKLLWEYELNANPEGIVSVFEVGGRQYIAFCASGEEGNETPIEEAFEARPGLASAQGYYVFVLPQTADTTTD